MYQPQFPNYYLGAHIRIICRFTAAASTTCTSKLINYCARRGMISSGHLHTLTWAQARSRALR
jgi:hypothetical protein